MSGEKRHIAVFSLAYDPFEGGAEIAVREIMVRSPEATFTVFTHRFEREWPAEEIKKNVRIVRLGEGQQSAGVAKRYGRMFEKIRYVFAAFRSARRAHAREPFTALWGIMASYGGMAALFMKLRRPRLPFLLTLQEGDAEAHILRRAGIFYPFWKIMFRRADAVQAISGYLADFARRHGATCPVTVVPNGVDLQKFQNPKSSAEGGSASGGKTQINFKAQNSKPFTIITTSRLVEKNGIDVLIRACATLDMLDTGNWKLEIIGDGPERENLERLTRELGINDRAAFLGQAPAVKIPRYLAGADIFVRPSRSEGLGSSFLEAMAAGLPVIGTSVGGIPDFLKDGETGLFARVDDPDDLAEKMGRLMRDAALRKDLAERGRTLIVERYGWDRIAIEMQKIFDELRKRPRVLVATGLFPPDVGGPATYSKFLSEKLPERGFLTDVISFGAVRHLPVGMRHAAYLWKLLRGGRRAEIIFAQDPVSVGVPAALAAILLRKRFLLKVVGDYAWEQGQQRFGVRELLDEFLEKRYGVRVELLRKVERWVAGRAARVIVPSEYLKGVVATWGVQPEKIIVIPNAVHIELPLTRRDARNALGLHGTVVFSAGRFVPWKGFHFLIAAVVALKPRFSDLSLIIAGDGPEQKNIKYQISKIKNGEAYIRLVGALPKQELAAYLAAADVFVLHTGYEGFSHQLIEAMAAGLPVVTTRVGGNGEIIQNEENGIVTPYGDEQALTDALARLIGDPKLRATLGERAVRTAAFFTKDAMLEKLDALLSDFAP